MWDPLSLEKLETLISECELDIEGTQLGNFWRLIKLPPQKWHQHPQGDEGGGFWVVAIWESQALWYNDIEEGFNQSPYSKFGTLDDYGAEQYTLKEALIGLFNSFIKQMTAAPLPHL